MRRSTAQNGAPRSQNTTNLLSTMQSATENNAKLKSNSRSMQDKVDSARRHLSTHQRQFHTGEDSSSGGESVENKSPHHHHHDRRSRSSPGKSKPKHTTSVLYSADLQYARSKLSGAKRPSPAKSISPSRRHELSFNQTLPDINLSPGRRSTYVVAGKRDSHHSSFHADATFTVQQKQHRDTFLVADRSTTTVPRGEDLEDTVVIAPGLLDDEYEPVVRKARAYSHSSGSVFHTRCAPKDPYPQEVSNAASWDVSFLPGSMKNARRVEMDRRSAAVDLLSGGNSDSSRYQMERTRREEEQLRRLASEQLHGRTTKEIFDSWVPLEGERKRAGGGGREEEKQKSTRRSWDAAAGAAAADYSDAGDETMTMEKRTEERREESMILGRLEEEKRLEQHGRRRMVMEDEAGYAMPLPRGGHNHHHQLQSDSLLEKLDRSHHEQQEKSHHHHDYSHPDELKKHGMNQSGHHHHHRDQLLLRTPSPHQQRQPSPDDEQFFTPATTAPRPSRVMGAIGDGETPILGRNSGRGAGSGRGFMERMSLEMSGSRRVERLRTNGDEADRSLGSSFHPTPTDREMRGGEEEERRERSIGEYATPIGRGKGGMRRVGGPEEEHNSSFLHNSSLLASDSPAILDRSRGLNESRDALERSLNRSLDHLSSLAARLTSQLEHSKANLSAIAAGEEVGGAAAAAAAVEQKQQRWEEGRRQGVAGDRLLSMEASVLERLPPMKEERRTIAGGAEEVDAMRRRIRDELDREHRSSLPEERRRVDEEERRGGRLRLTSPIPAARTSAATAAGPAAGAAAEGLQSLLAAQLGRLERGQTYAQEAERVAGVVQQIDKAAAAAAAPAARAAGGSDRMEAPIPAARSSRLPVLLRPQLQPVAAAAAAPPMPQLAIETAGGRGELMEMYEARHRNWHRRGDDISAPSPRSSTSSRSPSPLPTMAMPNPAEMRERQSKQGMLDQRAKAVRGLYLQLLHAVYKARFNRAYEEKSSHRGSPSHEEAFLAEQTRIHTGFQAEAAEAKRKAVDGSIRYRDFMEWLRDESVRMEKELKAEMEWAERKKWEKRGGESSSSNMQQDLSRMQRMRELERRLDERAGRAARLLAAAEKHRERREEVRSLEAVARKAVAFAEIPSSARSSLDDSSFLLLQNRRYSIGKEPVRVSSARESMESTTAADRASDSLAVAVSSGTKKDEMNQEEERKRAGMMREMRERLEEKRRQAEAVQMAMRESERRLNETELVSVAAQLAAHDDYIKDAAGVGRAIGQSVQPRSPAGLPPGVHRLDLSSLEEEEGEKKKEEEEKSADSSLTMSTAIGGGEEKRSSSSPFSSDSLKEQREERPAAAMTMMKMTSPSSPEEAAAAFSPLSAADDVHHDHQQQELDRSLPSTAASSGRQEIAVEVQQEQQPLPAAAAAASTPLQTPTPTPRSTAPTSLQPPSPVVRKETADSTMSSYPNTATTTTVSSSTTVPAGHRPLFSPLESSTSPSSVSSNGTSSSSREQKDTVVVPPATTMTSQPEATAPAAAGDESGSGTEEEEEKETGLLDLSTSSMKKAISVASEMTNPFDGFESSGGSGGSRKEEELMQPMQPQPATAAVAATPAAAPAADRTLSPQTVVERSPRVADAAAAAAAATALARQQSNESAEEISWGDPEEVLDVGGVSARSAEFDWGSGRSEEKKDDVVEEVAQMIVQQQQPRDEKKGDTVSDEREEQEEGRSRGKFASLRDRLSRISQEDEEEEKKNSVKSSAASTARSGDKSSTSTTSSSSSSGATTSSSSSTETSSRSTQEGSEASSKTMDGGGGEETPRAPSSAASSMVMSGRGGEGGGASSASGSIDFDAVDESTPRVMQKGEEESTSSRTPIALPSRRFRLSLDHSLSDSPRDVATTQKSSTSSTSLMNGGSRTGGGGISPRAGTPTSPRTPRSLQHLQQHAVSPGGGVSSPDGRRSRFTAVMPPSPRSGRRSTSPKSSLSREVSFFMDDSSLGAEEISRLSAVELPSSSSSTAARAGIDAASVAAAASASSALPSVFSSSSLPPLFPQQLQPATAAAEAAAPQSAAAARLSAILNASGSLDDEDDDVAEESVYDLMDVTSPGSSVLSSLQIAQPDTVVRVEEERAKSVSPPLAVSARGVDSLEQQWQSMSKKEFVQWRVAAEVDRIWSVVEKKGHLTPEDARQLAAGAAANELRTAAAAADQPSSLLREERIRLIRGVVAEVAGSIYPRDERRRRGGEGWLPKEIVPMRKAIAKPSKERLRVAIERELQPRAESKAAASRLRTLGVDMASLSIGDRLLYSDLYAMEERMFDTDLERADIVEILSREFID